MNDGTVNIAWAMSNDDALSVASTLCDYDQPIPSTCHRLVIDAGCSPTASDYAHGSTEVIEFGPAPTCQRGLSGHDNTNAWTYLLGR